VFLECADCRANNRNVGNDKEKFHTYPLVLVSSASFAFSAP